MRITTIAKHHLVLVYTLFLIFVGAISTAAADNAKAGNDLIKEGQKAQSDKQFEKAKALYLKAFAGGKGNMHAAYLLGLMAEEGQTASGKSEFKEAKSWYLQAAKGKDADAACALAGVLDYENNSKTPNSEAIGWLTKAADWGSLDAQRKLGTLYSHGKNELNNPALCFKYRSMAADRGDTRNCFKVGMLLMKGHGTKRDVPKAISYFKKSSETTPEACLQLYKIYKKGDVGVPANEKEAKRWQMAALDLSRKTREDDQSILESIGRRSK